MKFDEWYGERKCYGNRVERSIYDTGATREDALRKWLKAAYELGQEHEKEVAFTHMERMALDRLRRI